MGSSRLLEAIKEEVGNFPGRSGQKFVSNVLGRDVSGQSAYKNWCAAYLASTLQGLGVEVAKESPTTLIRAGELAGALEGYSPVTADNREEALRGLQAGDVVLFSRGGGGHISVFTGRVERDDSGRIVKIECRGGNQGAGGVNDKWYDVGRLEGTAPDPTRGAGRKVAIDVNPGVLSEALPFLKATSADMADIGQLDSPQVGGTNGQPPRQL